MYLNTFFSSSATQAYRVKYSSPAVMVGLLEPGRQNPSLVVLTAVYSEVEMHVPVKK